MKRFATRSLPDTNQDQVIAWYEQLFCSVADTHGVGFGFPDLVVGIAGCNELVEVKTEAGHAEASQLRFERDWRGAKITTVRTQADVINHVQNVRERISRGQR